MAIKGLKNRKAPVEDASTYRKRPIDIHDPLFNKIYETRRIPQEWLVSIFLVLPKKKNTSKCEEHRILSLMKHALKVLLNIIHARIYKKLNQNIAETQFGFRNGLYTKKPFL